MTVERLLNINSIHLQFLNPLAKWRILDLKGLREEVDYPSHPTVFEKMIRRLEKANVLKSFKDPWTNKKFIYLTKLGEKLVGDPKKALLINEETMLHDAKVVQFTRSMLERTCVSKIVPEHLINENRLAKTPDALIEGVKGGQSFSMAFELEITRKSKERICEKMDHYLSSDFYDYVFYLFCSPGVLKSYKNLITEKYGDKALEKVMLFYNPSLMSRKLEIEKTRGFFKGKEVSFNDLF